MLPRPGPACPAEAGVDDFGLVVPPEEDKPEVTATLALEALCGVPRPARAETSDGADAVFDRRIWVRSLETIFTGSADEGSEGVVGLGSRSEEVKGVSHGLVRTVMDPADTLHAPF